MTALSVLVSRLLTQLLFLLSLATSVSNTKSDVSLEEMKSDYLSVSNKLVIGIFTLHMEYLSSAVCLNSGSTEELVPNIPFPPEGVQPVCSTDLSLPRFLGKRSDVTQEIHTKL